VTPAKQIALKDSRASVQQPALFRSILQKENE
jgi:hypothetical protein